ncbi:ABC-type sugar transport system substrate-binding protein [Bradyrhizobium sp. USDA 4354]
MRRRKFLGFFGMAAISALEAFAQKRVPVVEFVGFATPEIDNATLVPFRKAMADLGYVEGRNIVIEAHSTAGDVSRGLALIDDLVARQVDVLLSPGPAAARRMG